MDGLKTTKRRIQMRFKSLAFAALALICSAGVTVAQQAEPPGPGPVDPAQLKKLLPNQGSKASSNPDALGAGGATLDGVGRVALGWNYFHATNCQWYFDGSNNYLYVIPSEGGFWVYRNNIYAAQTFLTGCVNGYWSAVHVINGTTGDFDSVYTYAFK
jgi:hypothetical protein